MTRNLPETIVDRVLELHAALSDAGLPYAFGGAIALGYATEEPRMTRDVDVNVFVNAAEARSVLAALPRDLAYDDDFPALLERDGQGRIQSGMFPVDLFLTNMALHSEARDRVRTVPFAETSIPVLSALDIVIFKAMFDRTKDWADIEAVFAAEAVALHEVRDELTKLVGPADHRLSRLAAAAEAGRAT